MKGSELPKSVSFICKTSKKSRMWFRSFGVQIVGTSRQRKSVAQFADAVFSILSIDFLLLIFNSEQFKK